MDEKKKCCSVKRKIHKYEIVYKSLVFLKKNQQVKLQQELVSVSPPLSPLSFNRPLTLLVGGGADSIHWEWAGESHMRGGNASIAVWVNMTGYDQLWMARVKSCLLIVCIHKSVWINNKMTSQLKKVNKLVHLDITILLQQNKTWNDLKSWSVGVFSE